MSLEVAQAYLARGWSVVPGHTALPGGDCSCRQDGKDGRPLCENVGKHPRIRWREFQERIPTAAEVKYWWTRWPDANYCLITGQVSGVGAIDVDPRHGGDEAWREWTAQHTLPATPVSITGGGGQHIFFTLPQGAELPRAIGILPGVDWMGDHGYLVLPDSTHSSGRRYAWDTEFHPDDMPLAPMPGALQLLVLRRHANAQGEPTERRPAINAESFMAGRTKIPEGERNETLTRLAGYFAESSGTPGELFITIDSINQRCCEPGPISDPELMKISESIWGREHRGKEASTAPGIDSVDVEALAHSTADKLEISSVLWGVVGLPVVTDWYQIQGDKVEYVLVTPEDELRFIDLLRYEEDIRELLLNRLGVLAPRIAKGQRWKYDQWALAVRNCAREVLAEGRTAEERIIDWVAAYSAKLMTRYVEVGKELEALRSGPIEVDGWLTVNVNHFATFIETQFGEQMKVGDLRHLLRRAGWQPDGKLRAYRRPPAVAMVENEGVMA